MAGVAGAMSGAIQGVMAILNQIPTTKSLTVTVTTVGVAAATALVDSIPTAKSMVINAVNDASAVVASVQASLDSLHDKTVTITVVTVYETEGSPSRGGGGGAGGGGGGGDGGDSYQFGGTLPRTGLFYGHAGEEIVPKSRVNAMNNFMRGAPSSIVSNQGSRTPSMQQLNNETSIILDGDVFAKKLERHLIIRENNASAY